MARNWSPCLGAALLVTLLCRFAHGFSTLPVVAIRSPYWSCLKISARPVVYTPSMSGKSGGEDTKEQIFDDPLKTTSHGLDEETVSESVTTSAFSTPQAKEEEKISLLTYVFGKPGELDRDLARLGTSRRRFISINAAALVSFIAF